MLLSMPAYSQQSELPGVTLPEGETVIELGWRDDANLLLVSRSDDGFLLHNLALATAELTPVRCPSSFSNLKPIEPHGGPHFHLAPSCNSLAVLVDADSPLKPHRLAVYSLANGSLLEVPIRTIPADFWVEQVAWNTSGNLLYLAPRLFLDPDQPHSLARFDLKRGTFSGVELKANVDLIERLVCLAGKDVLIARCRSFHGEYPANRMLVSINVLNSTEEVMHSKAEGLELNALADGRVLIYDPQNGTTGWQLPESGAGLMPSSRSPSEAGNAVSTADGNWLAYRSGSRFDVSLGSVTLQHSSGSLHSTSIPASLYAFNPDGTILATLNADGRKVHFFPLPQPEQQVEP